MNPSSVQDRFGPAHRGGILREIAHHHVGRFRRGSGRRQLEQRQRRHRIAAFGKLRSHQPTVRSFMRDQLRVATALRHRAVLQHQDAVGVDHARQAVRQDQRGAAGHQAIQRLLDDCLVLRIDRRQRLVQHQDRRVAQQCAGDGDTLALAARQARAAFPDHRLVVVRQSFDEVMRIGGARGGDDVGLAGVGAAEAQVFLDRPVKQIGVLRHHRDHPAHRLRIERAQILTADADRAALRIVQTQEQADDRGLARPAGANDADAFTGGDGEGEVPMRGASAAGIGEAYRFECDAGR